MDRQRLAPLSFAINLESISPIYYLQMFGVNEIYPAMLHKQLLVKAIWLNQLVINLLLA